MIFVFADQIWIAQQQIRFAHISILQQIPRQPGRGNVVGLVEEWILQKTDLRVFLTQNFKLLAEIAAHQHDFHYARLDNSIQQRFHNRFAMHSHQRLRRIQGNRHQT